MKKIGITLIISGIMFVLAACGSQAKTPEPTNESQTIQETEVQVEESDLKETSATEEENTETTSEGMITLYNYEGGKDNPDAPEYIKVFRSLVDGWYIPSTNEEILFLTYLPEESESQEKESYGLLVYKHEDVEAYGGADIDVENQKIKIKVPINNSLLEMEWNYSYDDSGIHLSSADGETIYSENTVAGIYYHFTNGTEIPFSEDEAFQYLMQFKDSTNYGALYTLGHCYECGIGTEVDFELAAKNYLKSAELGFDRAMGTMGNCYKYGTGVEPNLDKAMEWYLKGAEAGHIQSYELAADLYADSTFSGYDLEKAKEYYQLAIDKADEAGAEAIKTRATEKLNALG